MANIIYAAPYTPPNPPAPDDPWPGLEMTWTGWDGSFWDIGNALEGISLQAGVRGLNMPPIEHYKDEYAAVYGARWRGLTVKQREIFWPVFIYSDAGSMGWTLRDRAFWKTMNPKQTGLWTVIQSSGEARTLQCRFRDDGGHAVDLIPQKTGWAKYGLYLDAEQPMWEGPEIARRFKAASSSTGFASYPWQIDSGHGASNATVDNPGDDDSWPVWEIEGPITSVTVGVDGRTVVAPVTLLAGEKLVIDTHPTAQTALKDGVDVFTSLTATDWAPVPAGEAIPLTISITGTGLVWCRFKPQHYRAW